jgi:branched-chain amino acid transport system ATP-binding protein
VTNEASDQLLRVEDIDTYYGRSHILKDVSVSVGRHEVVTLLGRNGVGKTTTLRSIMGLTPPNSGSVAFDGEEIRGLEPYQVRRRGIAWVPEGRRVFSGLTVEENLRIAANPGVSMDLVSIYERFPRLDERRNQNAQTLSGGEQQLLAIARGLVGPPTRLLLLDEPSEGLDPRHQEEVKAIIAELREDVPILLVEQNVELALRLADRAYMMETGEIKYEGSTDDLALSDATVERYLGVG